LDTTIWRVAGDPLIPGPPGGPLAGLTVAVKDLIAVAGQAVGAGNPVWLADRHPEPASAPVLVSLLSAGASVRGIARTDEFAYSLAGANAHYGTPPNPAAPDRVSGGSTSGPGSAVALGQADIGLGTDTAGSIRVPASYQGLVGLRTTHGTVSTEGVLPLARSFDTIGWITRDLATSRSVARAVLGGPAAPGTAGAPVIAAPVWDPRRTVRLPAVEALASADVHATFGGWLSRAAASEALPRVEADGLRAETVQQWCAAFRAVQAWEAWQAHGPWLREHPGSLGADVAERFAIAAGVSDESAAAGRRIVRAARDQLTRWLGDGVIVIPTAPGAAPLRDAPAAAVQAARAATMQMTCLASIAGAPAVSIPVLRSADGLPVGVTLVAARGCDQALLGLATAAGGPP